MRGLVFRLCGAGLLGAARRESKLLVLKLAVLTCAAASAATDLPASDGVDELPPQLRAAQENALKWWRDPANHLTSVESTSTDEQGQRQRTIVFILRDPNGRSLAVSRAGSPEMQVFFQQQLDKLLRQATRQHALTQPQLDKLRLAAELDIARFNRRVQEAMQRMNSLGDWAADNRDLEQVNADEVAATKSSLAGIAENCEQGLFDNQSLYTRVLGTLLQ